MDEGAEAAAPVERDPVTAKAVAELKAAAAKGFIAMRAVGRAVPASVPSVAAATAEVDDSDPNIVARRFRLMSASHFRPTMGWFAVTIKMPEDTLKAALPLFGPQADANGTTRPLTVYKDHHTSVSEWCGTIDAAPEYVEASDEIPGGVENVIRLDRVADAKIARGVETGALRSVSAGFTMEWEKSHPEMGDDDFFFAAVDDDEVDGERVALVCTAITGVDEISVVWEGADPHAKQIGAAATASGEIVDTPDAEASSNPEQEADQMWKEYLIAALGLAEDADDEAIKAAQERVIAEREAFDDADESLTRLTAALGVDADDVDAAVAEVITLKRDTVPRADYDALVKAGAERDCADAVDAAVREGRIAPFEREDMLAMARSDLGAVKRYLAKRKPSSAVPLGEQAPETDGTGGAGANGLTAKQLATAKRLGITDLDAYAAQLKRRPTIV